MSGQTNRPHFTNITPPDIVPETVFNLVYFTLLILALTLFTILVKVYVYLARRVYHSLVAKSMYATSIVTTPVPSTQ